MNADSAGPHTHNGPLGTYSCTCCCPDPTPEPTSTQPEPSWLDSFLTWLSPDTSRDERQVEPG